MAKLLHKLFVFISILLLSQSIFAQVADPGPMSFSDFANEDKLEERIIKVTGGNTSEKDLSKKFLQMLYGNVSTLQGKNNIIGKAFELFNYGILSIVAFIVSYTVVTSVIGTSQDGGGAFSTRVSPWTIARTSGGVVLMVPGLQGYSVIQTMVMKVILMGIAFANTAWVGLIRYDQTLGNSLTVQAPTTATVYTVANIQKAQRIAAMSYYQLSKVYRECLEANGFTPNACSSVAKVEEGENKNYKIFFTSTSSTPVGYQTTIPKIVLSSWGTNKQVISYNNTLVNGNMKAILNSQLGKLKTHISAYNTYVEGLAQSPELKPTYTNTESKYFRELYECPNGQRKICEAGAKNEPQSAELTAEEQAAYNNGMGNIKPRRAEINSMILFQGTKLITVLHSTTDAQGTAAPSGSWHDTGLSRGWLSAGLYYDHLLTQEAPVSRITKREINDLYKVDTYFQYPSAQAAACTDKETCGVSVTEVKPLVPNANQIGTAIATIIGGDNVGMKIVEKLDAVWPFIECNGDNNGSSCAPVEALLPSVFGDYRNTVGGWFMGANPYGPINNLATMSVQVAQQLLGFKYLTESSGKNTSCHSLLKQVFNSNGFSSDAAFRARCLYPGSMIDTVLFPENVVNPLQMIKSLGRQMIKQSVMYYRDTIEDLFREMKNLATKFFNTTTTTNSIAGGSEAGMAGTVAAPGGVAIGTANEITVNGLKRAFNGVKMVMEIFVPLGTAVAGTIFALGVVLGVYIPLLPFVLFLFGAVAWLMSTVEAMVAAPLVALGMTHPEGHDLLGKSEQALILLLGVFIRPIVMLFGLLMAIVVSQILIKLFHLGFLTVTVTILGEAISNNSDALTELGVVVSGILLVYVYILISVIEQSFSLIYVIPEKILRWIGGPQEQSGIGQLAEQVKGETQQAAGQAAQGAGQSTASPNIDGTGSNPTFSPVEPKEGGAAEDSGADVSGGGGGEGASGGEVSSNK